MRDLDEAQATMRGLKGLRGGRLDLVTMPSPGMEPLTTILTRFSQAHPDVTVNAEAAFTPEEVLALVAPAPPRSAFSDPPIPPWRPISRWCRWNVKPWC